jgi:hypothetical protein
MGPLGAVLYAGALLTVGRPFMRDILDSARGMLPRAIAQLLGRLVGARAARI